LEKCKKGAEKALEKCNLNGDSGVQKRKEVIDIQ
jgi:hypothetical protein